MLDRLRLKPSFASTTDVISSRLPGVLAVVATLVIGMGAAGCGSSNTTSTPAISKAEFLAKGNAICVAGQKVLNAASSKAFGNKQPSQVQIASYVNTTFAPAIQHQIDAVRALGAPSGEQATVTNMLNTGQTDLNSVKSNPSLLAGNSDPFASFARLAHPYGLTACAAKS